MSTCAMNPNTTFRLPMTEECLGFIDNEIQFTVYKSCTDNTTNNLLYFGNPVLKTDNG